MSTLAELQAAHMARKLGMFNHFGLATFNDDQGDTDHAASTFAPTDLDVEQWVRAAKRMGCRYAVLTAQHFTGFALWPSAVTAHNISASATWYAANGNPDIVQRYVDACAKYGIACGLYVNFYDAYYRTNINTNAMTTGAAAYNTYTRAKITELLTRYPGLALLWIDSWHFEDIDPTDATYAGYTRIDYASMYALVKSIQPNCLLQVNNHEHNLDHSDISGYEAEYPASDNTLPAESCFPLQVDYFWNTTQSAYNFANRADVDWKVKITNNFNGNLLLNLAPDTTGKIPQIQLAHVFKPQADFYDQIVLAHANIKGYYPFSEASGLWAYDMTPNMNHSRCDADDGTNPTKVTWGTGNRGGPLVGVPNSALLFGAADSFATMIPHNDSATTDPTAIEIVGAITIECFFNLTALPGGTDVRYIISRAYDGAAQGYQIRFNRTTGTTVIDAGSYDGSAHQVTWTMTGIAAKEWHHLVWTHNGTSTGTLYIDGVSVATVSDAKGAVACTSSPKIGGDSTNVYNGALAKLAIYNAAISAAEVTAHYRAATQYFYEWPVVASQLSSSAFAGYGPGTAGTLLPPGIIFDPANP